MIEFSEDDVALITATDITEADFREVCFRLDGLNDFPAGREFRVNCMQSFGCAIQRLGKDVRKSAFIPNDVQEQIVTGDESLGHRDEIQPKYIKTTCDAIHSKTLDELREIMEFCAQEPDDVVRVIESATAHPTGSHGPWTGVLLTDLTSSNNAPHISEIYDLERGDFVFVEYDKQWRGVLHPIIKPRWMKGAGVKRGENT